MKNITIIILFLTFSAFAQLTVESSGGTVLMKILENGNVGIGTQTNPTEKLEVAGKTKTNNFQMTGNSPGTGKILTSDANGNASWGQPMQIWELTSTYSSANVSDPGSLVQFSTDFTIPVTGYYLHLWTAEIQSPNTTSGGWLRLFKSDNSSSYTQLSAGTANGNPLTEANASSSKVIFLQAGTVVHVLALHYGSGVTFWSAPIAGGGFSWGQMVLLYRTQ
ncbi:hypothetical protein JW935_14000 [candidate division KSB1 bacterium]|nr:hypothetical protein [candidate division KSB1 bacterium]